MPNEFIVQIALLMLAAALFAAAFAAGLRHMRRVAAETGGRQRLVSSSAPSMGRVARGLVLTGTGLSIVLLGWRVIASGNITLPLTSHFDAFLLLGLLLAGMVVYLRWTKNLRGLAFFLLPMIAVLFMVGAGLSITQTALHQENYRYHSIWSWLHILSIVIGTVCFAAGCVGGIVYLIAARQLKHRSGAGGGGVRVRWAGLPPLASIERINRLMVYIGFPALTLVIITGILIIAQEHEGFRGLTPASPKIILAFLAWIVYALLLQVPLSPAFRGPRAAWLSILGFALFLGGYVAVVWMK